MRGKLLKFALPLIAFLALIAAGCGGGDNETSGGTSPSETTGGEGGTLVFGAAADPVALDGALVSDGESLRAIDQIFETLVTLKPGTTEVAPMLAESWEASHDGTDVDVPPAPGGQVPGRHRLQRGRRLLQLRPLVQLQGLLPEPERELLLAVRLRRLRDVRPEERRSRGQSLQELRGARPEHGGDHADDAVLVLPSGSRAVAIRDREPGGAAAVQCRRRLRRCRRDLPPDRHVCDPASDRNRAVHVQVVDAGGQARPRAQPQLLGRDVGQSD